MKNLPYYLALSVCLIACGRQPAKTPATLVLHNGHFFTADSSKTTVTAVAVNGDRIVYAGSEEGAKSFAGDGTVFMDLEGAFVTPGLIEGHGHYISLGRSLQNLQLAKTKTWREIVNATAEKARNKPAGEWIEGRGWHQEKWTESAGRTVNGYPYHDDLSAVTPDHPVVLSHASGHALMANAKAMALAGISKETPDPVGGRIVRDARGNLTGVFEENAMDLIYKPLSEWHNKRGEAEKQAAFDEQARLAARECLAKGITSFQDAGSDFWEIEQFKRLAEAGKMDVRVWAMISQPRPSDIGKLAGFPQERIGHAFFTVRGVKAYLDGALGSYGAWLLAPYADKPDGTGQNVTPIDTIAAIAAACKQYGLQLCVHAIGDRANREMLDLFERIHEGQPTRRWRIEHAQHIDPADQPRFRTLGVIAAMQAIHCTSDAPFVVKRLGRERAQTGAYPWRALLDRGARIGNGTDVPVEDVDAVANIYAAVTRKRADSGFTFFPEQAMTREEALLSLTIWNAYAAFEEMDKGSITVGKLADFTVFSNNLLQCKEEEILQTQILKTIVGGQVKYQKK